VDELLKAKFVLTKREHNRVADLLAKHAYKDLSSALWLRHVSNFVVTLLANDVTLPN
jgi:hypothetical protein